jgi:hypothetical protein
MHKDGTGIAPQVAHEARLWHAAWAALLTCEGLERCLAASEATDHTLEGADVLTAWVPVGIVIDDTPLRT